MLEKIFLNITTIYLQLNVFNICSVTLVKERNTYWAKQQAFFMMSPSLNPDEDVDPTVATRATTAATTAATQTVAPVQVNHSVVVIPLGWLILVLGKSLCEVFPS